MGPLASEDFRADADVPRDLLRVSVEDHPEGAVVTVTGEVDLHTSSTLRAALDRALGGTAPVVVVDLSAVTFLSSSGLSALVELRRGAESRARAVRLVGDGRPVRRPLQAAGLVDLFTWYPDVAAAITSTDA
ncbi:MAG: STAS domain-containing protein [Actinomycetota bacterium]|nr:STAS domain-containing protein [Actinomycetota bacterium]